MSEEFEIRKFAAVFFLVQQMSDKLKIWAEIKRRAPDIIKNGGNPIDLLLWSQEKTFGKLSDSYEIFHCFTLRPSDEKT